MRRFETSRDQRFLELTEVVTRQLIEAQDPVEVVSLVVRGLADVLEGTEVGVMLAEKNQRLRVVGSSTEQLRSLELFEVQHSEGPCFDAFRSNSDVLDKTLNAEHQRWPHLAPLAESLGFRRASALPLHCPDGAVGAMNLFSEADRELADDELQMSRALAGLATLGILRDRSQTTVTQLQRALDSRIVVEQAKGALATQLGIDTDEAFEMLRSYARGHNRKLTDVGQDLVNGVIPEELARGRDRSA